jgi:hypothetical protein
MEDSEAQSQVSSMPPMVMPTGRLRDVVETLDTKQPSVLNLDACLNGNNEVFEYILGKVGPSITTLSLRFNDLKDEGTNILSEWLAQNDTVETVYLMGTGISAANRQNIENAFRKNLVGHRTTNMGFTLIRVFPRPVVEPEPE